MNCDGDVRDERINRGRFFLTFEDFSPIFDDNMCSRNGGDESSKLLFYLVMTSGATALCHLA
jgi:hypothetical protein